MKKSTNTKSDFSGTASKELQRYIDADGSRRKAALASLNGGTGDLKVGIEADPEKIYRKPKQPK